MDYDQERLNKLAGTLPYHKSKFGDDEIRQFLNEQTENDVDEDEPENEVEECNESLVETRVRTFITREIRQAIEELRKSRGSPIRQIKFKRTILR